MWGRVFGAGGRRKDRAAILVWIDGHQEVPLGHLQTFQSNESLKRRVWFMGLMFGLYTVYVYTEYKDLM